MALVADGIVFTYAPGAPAVLDDLSIKVERSCILGLTGPSGAGKTTLARILTGLRTPDSGTVTVDGAPVAARRGRMDGRVGLLHQSPRTATNPRLCIADIITEPLSRHDDGDLHTLAAGVGLTADLLERFPGQVSDGQLQRACVARMLAAAPDYVVCDEPTAMLDAAATATIAALLRGLAANGTGILVASHDHLLLGALAETVVALRDLQNVRGLRKDVVRS